MSALLEKARRSLAEAEARFSESHDAINAAAEDISSDDLTALNVSLDEAEADVLRSRADVERYERIADARSASPVPADVTPVVTRNEPIYRKDGQHSFFIDLVRSSKGDLSAAERIRRNQDEVVAESRATGLSSDIAGLLPPVWLAQYAADEAVAGRPFANAVPTAQLPPAGEAFTVPAVTVGLSTGVQNPENSAVANAVATVASITHNLVTIAGQSDVSRQSLDRSYPGLDTIIYRNLLQHYNQTLDNQMLNGSGSSGQHLGVRNVSSVNTSTFTGSTASALLVKIYDAIQKIASNRFAEPDMIVMHPRRAAWLASGTDANRPVFQQGGLMLSSGQQDKGFVGTMAGLPVVADANVVTNQGASTNQDEIYVVRSADMVLMEGDTREATYEEVLSNTLAVRLQLYAYSVWFPDRFPKSITIISGSGLATPTF